MKIILPKKNVGIFLVKKIFGGNQFVDGHFEIRKCSGGKVLRFKKGEVFRNGFTANLELSTWQYWKLFVWSLFRVKSVDYKEI